jgi:CBS domain-containing protein
MLLMGLSPIDMEERRLPTIKDIMISTVITIDAKKTIYDAARIMGEKRIGSVVVTKDLKAVGIFTERDLLTKAIANDIDLKNTKVESCMSSPLITIDEETPLKDAIILMASRGIMRLPITMRGELVGIVTGMEIFNFLSLFMESLL